MILKKTSESAYHLFVWLFVFVYFRGEFEYELWLQTDLYTGKHTQWYYFRVANVTKDTTYRFTIVNLMKVSIVACVESKIESDGWI